MESAAADADVLARSEAQARAGRVGDISYRIDLELSKGAKTYRGDVTASFSNSGDTDTFMEFVGGRIDRFEINGSDVEPQWNGRRITLPVELLGDRNEVRVAYENEYDHTGEGFHQFVDPQDGGEYLYTGFEPYQAHRLFPCFDQPDLKATYELTVTAPDDWEVVSAGRMLDEEKTAEGRRRRSYEQTAMFSTYLFAVVAGPYNVVKKDHEGLELGLYCRASMFEHMDSDELFETTIRGLEFYSDFFGTPYPFTKYDQLFVPEFNWGGMENVGAVTYTDQLIFRDPPTHTMRVRRAEVVLHELAHMWFGDLVTMEWWNDLWLNESFATFIAYLALDDSQQFGTPWQDFNTRVKSPAYHDDQLPTTHPIADEIGTTDETFLNFDQITYGKGASTLRQLVAMIGNDAFREGLHTYFRRHSFGNTTLADFLAALQEGSGQDLIKWSARWLKTSSVNTLAAEWTAAGDKIDRLRLIQSAPDEHPTLRQHTVEVALVSEDAGGISVDAIPVSLDGAETLVPGASGRAVPSMVFPNFRDLTYAKIALDRASIDFVKSRLPAITDPFFRQLVWSSLWEMVRDRQLSSIDFLDLVEDHLTAETSLAIVEVGAARVARTLASYVPEEAKAARSRSLVAAARAALDTAPEGDHRVVWTRAILGAASDPEDLALAGRLVDETEGVTGSRIDQEMRWQVAIRWAAHAMSGADDRLADEAERDPSDRGQRATLRGQVAKPAPDVKEETWNRIHEREYGSLHTAGAAMSAFGWAEQKKILAPYASGFFARVPDVFGEWEWEAAKAYFTSMFPDYLVDGDNLGHATALLNETAEPRLKRLLAESIDGLKRAIACRALAAEQLAAAVATHGDQLA